MWYLISTDICLQNYSQKPLANVVRVVLIFPILVPLFGPRARDVGGAAWVVYDNILKVNPCAAC